MKSMIWSGQGPVYLGTFDPGLGQESSGFLVSPRSVGCSVSRLTTEMKRETKTIKESCSGQRLDIAEIETSKSLEVRLDLVMLDRLSLRDAFFGTSTTEAAGSVTGEVLPMVAAGDFAFLLHPNASSIVVTDSAATPVILDAGTHYKVVDAAHGAAQFLDVSALTQPFKVAYSFGGYGNITAGTATQVRTGLVFTGRNQNGAKARVTIPNMILSPASGFDWIGDEESKVSLIGKAFYTPELAQDDSLFGPFMRIDALPAD